MGKIVTNKINPLYRTAITHQQIKTAFFNNTPPSIQLQNFLSPKFYQTILKKTKKVTWKPKTILDQYKYHIARPPKELLQVFQSPTFTNLISSVFNKKITCTELELCAFGHKDYTLLHDKIHPFEGIILELELTPLWNKKWGGYTSYVRAGEELLRNNPTPNTLTIIHQQKKVFNFTKYINHFAGKKKRIVLRGKSEKLFYLKLH